MKQVLVAILILLSFSPEVTIAAPLVYTQANFWGSYQEAPVSFYQDRYGNFHGQTLSGRFFSQINIENSQLMRLQRFSIDDVIFYISDRGVFEASSDLVALSVYMTLTS